MAYNSAYKGSEIDAAVGAVKQKENDWDGKQDALTGAKGQFVGFGAEGKPTPQGVTAGDVKFSDGQTFQQKYDNGELTGPAGNNGAAGAKGDTGAAGAPATINGVNALTIQAGGNVQMSQEGGVVTISAKPKALPVTLTAAGWISPQAGDPGLADGSESTAITQTVAVPGVSANENTQEVKYIYPSASAAAVAAAGLYISATAANSVTFACWNDVPTEDIAVCVEITEINYVS